MSKSTKARHQEISKVSEGKVAEVLTIHKSAHSTISKEMRTSVMKVTPEIAPPAPKTGTSDDIDSK